MPNVYRGTTPIGSAWVGVTKLASIWRGVTKIWSPSGDYIDGPPATDIALWNPQPVSSTISVVTNGIRFTAGAAAEGGGITDELEITPGQFYEIVAQSGPSTGTPIIEVRDGGAAVLAVGVPANAYAQFQFKAVSAQFTLLWSSFFNTTPGVYVAAKYWRLVRMISATAGEIPIVTSTTGWSYNNGGANLSLGADGIRSTFTSAVGSTLYLRRSFPVVSGQDYVLTMKLGAWSGVSNMVLKATGTPITAATFVATLVANAEYTVTLTASASGNVQMELTGGGLQNEYMTFGNYLIQQMDFVYVDAFIANDLSRWTSNSATGTTAIAQSAQANRGIVLSNNTTLAGTKASAYIDFTGLVVNQVYTLVINHSADECDGAIWTWLSGVQPAPEWIVPALAFVATTQSFTASATTARLQIAGIRTANSTNRFYVNALALGKAL